MNMGWLLYEVLELETAKPERFVIITRDGKRATWLGGKHAAFKTRQQAADIIEAVGLDYEA